MANAEEVMIKITSFLTGDGFAKTQKAMSQVQAEQGKQATAYQKVAQAGVQSNSQIANSFTKVTQQLGPVGTAINGTYNIITSGASKVVKAASNIAPPFVKNWVQAANGSNILHNAFNSVQSGVGRVTKSAGEIASKFGQAFSQAGKSAGEFINSLQGMDGVVAGVLGGIGVQNIGEMIFGNSMKAEKNQILLSQMAGTADGAKKLFNIVDKATNEGAVSMQQVIPAMNAFQKATQSTGVDMNNYAPIISKFGSYVMNLKGSAAEAEGAMFDLSKGITGAFASLDQFGITEQTLMNTGLWTGRKDDVERYMAAVEALIPSQTELMNTTEGVLTQIQKKFSVAAKAIGKDLLPVIKSIAQGFIELNNVTGGNLAKAILLIGGGLSAVLAVAGVLGAVFPAITAGLSFLIPGFVTASAAGLGFAGTLDFAALSLVAFITGETAATVATVGLSTALWSMAAALLANPITWIVVAIIALIVAIQELGKYMGWWSDWGTMVDAFSAGLQRLWSTFSNNPQVIAFVNQVKAAWEGLMQILSPIGKALTSFWNSLFPENKAGEGFDIVRGIIDVFGLFGEAIANYLSSTPIGLILSNLDAIGAAFQTLYGVLSGVVGAISGAFASIGQFFSNIWSKVAEFFLSSFYNEQGKFLGVIPGILNLLWKIGSAILAGIMALPGIIMSGLTTLWNIGVRIGEAIYNSLAQVPGLVTSAITSLPGIIGNALTNMFSSASNTVSNASNSLIDSLSTAIMEIPQRILGIIGSIGFGAINIIGMIVSFLFGENAGTAVTTKLNEVLSIIMGALSGLAGFISSGIVSILQGGFNFIQAIVGWLFGDGDFSQVQASANTLLASITSFLSNLPHQIINFIGAIFSQGIDIVSMIVGAIFGQEAGAAFKEKAMNLLNSITDSLHSIAEGIINTINAVFGGGIDIVSMIFGSVSETGSQVIGFFQQLWGVLQQVGTFIMSVFQPAWDLIVSTFLIIWQHVQNLITIFTALLQGQMTLPQALQAIWTVITSLFTSVLGNIVTRVVSFGSNLISKFRSIFSNAVNSAKSFLSQLPGIVWQEMMNVAAKIGGAANHIFAQVQATFGNIVYWAKKVLGIASPGFISKAIGGEMNYVADFIIDGASKAYTAAKHLSDKIIEGFGNPVLPSIGNEGIDPYEYDPLKTGNHKLAFPYDTTDFNIPTTDGALILKSADSKDKGVTIGKIEVKNTINVDGSNSNSEEIAQQIEQKLASSLPADIMEKLVKLLNGYNISNGNVN